MAPSSSTTRTQQNHSKQKGHGKPCRTRKTSRTTRFQDKVTQRIFTITTLIHIYSEVRHKGQWTATAKDTYNEEKPNRFGWVNASMQRVPCPEKYPFYGLLLDGARASWPWSFQQKGLPEDISEEVQALSDSLGFEGYGHSHLNLKELMEKYLELMVSGPEAKELMSDLRDLIQNLQATEKPEVDVRAVFWFES